MTNWANHDGSCYDYFDKKCLVWSSHYWDSLSRAEWSICGKCHIMQCIFYYYRESLCLGWHGHLSWVLLWQIILLPHLHRHSSLGLVPLTIPIQALGWEYSQNIEAMSQLKSLGHRERRMLRSFHGPRIPWSVVTMLPIQSLWEPARFEQSRSFKVGQAPIWIVLRWDQLHYHCVHQHCSSTIFCLQNNCRHWIFPHLTEIRSIHLQI